MKRNLPHPFIVAVILSVILHGLISISFKLPDFVAVETVPDVVIKTKIQTSPVVKPKDKVKSIQDLLDEAVLANQQEQASQLADELKGQSFQLPPSAKVAYIGLINGGEVGLGEIDWQLNNQTYQLAITVPVPLLGQFTFTSIGKLDAFGVAPDFYEEIRGSRGTRSVSFMRDQRVVTFSSNQETSFMPLGTQDRFSVMLQLAALVAGNPLLDQKGVAREIPMATIDKVEMWTFVSMGDEVLEDAVDAYRHVRHFLRLPRDKEDKRRFEVWLARDAYYLPAKIKQTEVSGTTFELRIKNLLLK